jgi:integrase/recombinase XerD
MVSLKHLFSTFFLNNGPMTQDNAQIIENEDVNSQEVEILESAMVMTRLMDEPKKRPAKAKKMKPTGTIDYLDRNRSELLLQHIRNLKHRVAILIMMDAGLRVTECITLQMKNFDFKKKLLYVITLKKRGEVLTRQIPLSTRLIEALAEYIKLLNPKSENDYLFPGMKKHPHITRKAMNRLCDRIKAKNPVFHNLHPHTLRHTFATQLLANGAALHNVSQMLGHTSYNTTLIYNHTPIELLRQNIEDATKQRLSWWQKLKRFFIKKASVTLINFSSNPSNFLVGREKELSTIIEYSNKNINLIILGKIGMGKSHLLKQMDFPNRKVLKLDEMANLKLTFVNLLLYLYDNDKEAIKELIFGDFDKAKIIQKLQKDSVQSLIEEIIRITHRHEYILMIDNVDGITARGMKCIELLKDHFTIITTARSIPINKANFLWNFERLELEPLSRPAALELIHRLSYDMDIEDYQLYRDHIWDQSDGNPRVIYELVERYRKEAIITDETIRSVRHIGGIPEIDMSFVIVFILAALTVLRYTSREVGGTNLRFIGGLALVGLMLSRFFLSKLKRKSI